MDDLHTNFGKQAALAEIMIFLKEKFGWSDVHEVITELRKEFHNKRYMNMQLKFQEKYKDSTLVATLCKRMDWTEQNKKLTNEKENILSYHTK